MRKIFGICAVLLLVSGVAAATDYWHFGLGVKGIAAFPGSGYSTAYGGGISATFGLPDSRFITQLEFDKWRSSYYQIFDGQNRKHQYSGLGAGFYEKYKGLEISSKFAGYVIGGFGAYFLDLKREVVLTGTTQKELRSVFLHAVPFLSAGLGLEGKMKSNLYAFVEGRYILIGSTLDTDKNIIATSAGIRIVF